MSSFWDIQLLNFLFTWNNFSSLKSLYFLCSCPVLQIMNCARQFLRRLCYVMTHSSKITFLLIDQSWIMCVFFWHLVERRVCSWRHRRGGCDGYFGGGERECGWVLLTVLYQPCAVKQSQDIDLCYCCCVFCFKEKLEFLCKCRTLMGAIRQRWEARKSQLCLIQAQKTKSSTMHTIPVQS